jgi:hypothetical protein
MDWVNESDGERRSAVSVYTGEALTLSITKEMAAPLPERRKCEKILSAHRRRDVSAFS